MSTTLTKSEILADEGKFQQACSLWVQHNISHCVSNLMYDIGQNLEDCARIFDFDYDEALGWFVIEDWQEPVEQFIADADLDDLETIADMVGYWSEVIGDIPTAIEKEDDDDVYYEIEALNIVDADEDEANQAALEASIDTIRAKVSALITNDDEYREIADNFNLDPEQHEVYEHWTLESRWSARDLDAQGEKTFEFGGMTIWARCTTGQSISMDGCIRSIVRGLDDNHFIWGEVL